MGRGFGGVQRGYLLNLRVKVPSAQIPVWRCSHIRHAAGSRRKLKAAILNSSAVKARKVCVLKQDDP